MLKRSDRKSAVQHGEGRGEGQVGENSDQVRGTGTAWIVYCFVEGIVLWGRADRAEREGMRFDGCTGPFRGASKGSNLRRCRRGAITPSILINNANGMAVRPSEVTSPHQTKQGDVMLDHHQDDGRQR